ncbi:MAG: hypothetical protein EOO38_02675 [Cytophagaceae bacterium]|nr:MAG: hypothetical protein EOO38_02675 [Cytophagaceae bacterium]
MYVRTRLASFGVLLLMCARSEFAGLKNREDPKGSLAVDSTSGQVFFSTLSNASIYSIDPTSKALNLLSNNQTDASTLLLIPKKLFVDNNELFTLDSALQTLVSIQPNGKRTTRFNITASGANPINRIGGLLLDSANQRLFVTDQAIGVLTLQDLQTGETIYLAK